MNKFLLSLCLLAFAAAKADVALETTLKENDKEAAHTVILSQSVTQAEFILNEVSYKVVVTNMVKNEDGSFVLTFDVLKVVDGQETLIAQPEFSKLPATLTFSNEVSSLTFNVNEVEATQQEVSAN